MNANGRLPVVIEVDPVTSRRGLPSQLAADLGGVNVLQRTLERVHSAEYLAPPLLAFRKEHEAAVRQLLGTQSAALFPHTLVDSVWQSATRRSRKWGSEGWRGGLLDSYFVSEQAHGALLHSIFEEKGWPQAMLIPAAAPFLDPQILDEIAAFCLDGMETRQLYLSTAPPGIGGDVVTNSAAALVAANDAPLDALVRIEPDHSMGDPERWAHHFAEEITGFRGRFTVDSAADLVSARALWAQQQGNTDCRALFDAVRADPDGAARVTPEELILELGDDEGGICLPRPGRPRQTDAADSTDSTRIADATFARVLEAFTHRDDGLLTFGGGYHDPLLDPQLEERIGQARAAGAYGIHVCTSGALLTAERADRLMAAQPDVITVDLVAPEQHILDEIAPGTPPLAARAAGLEALLAARAGIAEAAPLLVVSIVFEERSALHFDRYFDQWFGRVDRVHFRGADGPCGEVAERSLGVFSPPHRVGCGRLTTQMRIEADGSVPLCDRDPAHSTPCGDLRQQSVGEVWQGAAFQQARALHRDRLWQQLGHCGRCTSWFRFDGPAPASGVVELPHHAQGDTSA